ncbi:MAG: molybdopterin-guanine dinucleotide biosynthesis protein [Propionibacteriaceae bacterium]|nr:molybdopterin-guanine dinucleotide biosynthesis protein [Propionibacteriaceae bacterium]
MPHEDSPEKLARMHTWLDLVATEAGVEPEALAANQDALLDLISTVAHGPSRPGAPLTAFLVGVAVGRGADAADLIGRVDRLAAQTPS